MIKKKLNQIFKNDKSPYNSLETAYFALKFWVRVKQLQANEI